MFDNSARLGLPLIAPSQSQKHVTHNEALQRLDGLVQLVLEQSDAETPPAMPLEGSLWALGPSPSGPWAERGGMLAQWVEPTWNFMAPQDGWRAWDKLRNMLLVYDAGNWQQIVPALQSIDGIGIGTDSDPVNRLAVSAQATLLSHDGAGHRLKINKATVSETASLLYQSGWTGHAEMGLAGDNDFHVKVSADGANWTEALIVEAGTGFVRGAAIQADAADTTPGRLARADFAYGPGNLLGPVSRSGAMPTGAVIERGSTPNGDYVRFADGTQICLHILNLGSVAVSGDGSADNPYSTAGQNWTYPATYVAEPVVTLVPEVQTSVGVSRRLLAANYFSRKTATVFGIRAYRLNADSSPDEVTMLCQAIGRWF